MKLGFIWLLGITACEGPAFTQHDADIPDAADASEDVKADIAVEAGKDAAIPDAPADTWQDPAVPWCWHFCADPSTYPNGPYTSDQPLVCTDPGGTIGSSSWGYWITPTLGPAEPCAQATCPGSDGVGCHGPAGFGTVCCPAVHDGGCH